MIGFKMSVEFDVEKLEQKMRRAEARALKILGFETRLKAQNSIVNGTGPSRPGTPPKNKVGTLKRFILYSYDKETNSVTVGAKLLKRKSKDAAKALEHGGVSQTTKKKPIRVAARPFMEPAFQSVKRQSIPSVFANTLR